MNHVIIATRDTDAVAVLSRCLTPDFEVEVVREPADCSDVLRKKKCEFLFIDSDLLYSVGAEGEKNGCREALEQYRRISPALQVIVLVAPDRVREAVQAVKAGASDYLTFPVKPVEVKFVTESIYESLRTHGELAYLRDRFWAHESLEFVRTRCAEMRRLFAKVKSVAPTKTTVLLLGETGVGKGVIAKLIHQHSNRKRKPFIALHCGAMPENLLESELFGHEKGAFTGAVRRKLGKFEIARGGTVFLDEISTITPSAQVKLLQVLQEKTFQRVGGDEVFDTDVRIIAATNDDITMLSETGKFRRDLYYRLNVFPLEIPPLGARREDIPLISEVVLKRLNSLYAKKIHEIHPGVMDALMRYPWPGNVRELENILERAYILETSSILQPESFPGEFFESALWSSPQHVTTAMTLAEARVSAVEATERHYLAEQLTIYRGSIKDTARAAGISARQLHKLMTKYSLRKEDYKK